MDEIPKWLKSLSELSAKDAAKRVAKWKPSTLAKRANYLGIDTFAERTLKRIKKGTFTPSVKTVSKIGKQIIEQSKVVIDRVVDLLPNEVDFIPSMPTGSWIKLESWVEIYGENHPELNVEFSIARLHRFTWVYVSFTETIFTDRKWDDKPTSQSNKSDFIIYSITVTEGAEYNGEEVVSSVESWLQSSESDPQINVRDAKKEIEQIQERSLAAIGRDRYQWWAEPATQSAIFKFVGIGVLTV